MGVVGVGVQHPSDTQLILIIDGFLIKTFLMSTQNGHCEDGANHFKELY